MSEIQYRVAKNVKDACAAMAGAKGKGYILAGGTDLLVQMKSGAREPGTIVDVKKIPEMMSITEKNGAFTIGAAAPAAVIGEHKKLKKTWPGVVEAINLIGSTQVQGRASAGGNLCNASPAADGVPALLALGAEIELVSRGGKRRLALSDFILGPRKIALRPDEIASALLIPKPKGAAHSSFVKLGARKYLVISIVMAAGYLDVVGSRIVEARVAVGSCSPVALRLPALEAALKGEVAISNLARLVKPEHLAPLAPIDDVRASADYRAEAALVAVRRLLSELAV